jgi:hypothetical protein
MSRRFLNVSYEDRDLAKRLGARWDPSLKRWYYAKGSNLAKVFGWRAPGADTSVISERTNSGQLSKSPSHRAGHELSFGDLFDQANTRYG